MSTASDNRGRSLEVAPARPHHGPAPRRHAGWRNEHGAKRNTLHSIETRVRPDTTVSGRAIQ